MLSTVMDGGSAENTGAFFGLRLRVTSHFGRSKHAPLRLDFLFDS